MEELVFKNRNKEYGAYSLRKNYKNHLLFALLIVFIFLGSALTLPLMITPDKIVAIPGDTIVITIEPIRHVDADDPPPPPPPDPPSSKSDLVKDLAYKVPVVVENPTTESDLDPTATVNPSAMNPPSGPFTFDPVPDTPQADPVIDPVQKPEPLTIVQEMPQFKGGFAAMVDFIKNHLKYPLEAKELRITGTVYITFVVEPDGVLSEFQVARPIGGGCEEEAIRVLKSMPSWSPGKQNGIAVRVRLTLPVKFVLHD